MVADPSTTQVKSHHSDPRPTPQAWGLLQAQQAPPWSDRLWREACASLGIRLAD